MELVEKKEATEVKKRERATPDMPAEISSAIDAMCESDPFIKKGKVVAAVRAKYGAFLKMRHDQAVHEFVKSASSPDLIRKLIAGN